MSLPLSVMAAITTFLWTSYGFLKKDVYIVVSKDLVSWWDYRMTSSCGVDWPATTVAELCMTSVIQIQPATTVAELCVTSGIQIQPATTVAELCVTSVIQIQPATTVAELCVTSGIQMLFY